MKSLNKTEFDSLYEDLSKLYEDKQPDFESPMAKEIFAIINTTLHRVAGNEYSIEYKKPYDGITKPSVDIRAITDYPAANNLIATIKQDLGSLAQYITFTCHHEKDAEGPYFRFWFAINLASLPDNRWTADDLDKYGVDPEVTKRLDDLEDRMYRKANDTRSKADRWQHYKYAKDYENALNGKSLIGINSLRLAHDNTSFSLIPDKFADFSGDITTVNVPITIDRKGAHIEAKSIPHFTYENSMQFAKLFDTLANKNDSIGHLHNDTEYVLLIDRLDGKIVCIDRNNHKLNWLAGEAGTVKLNGGNTDERD